MSDVSTNLYKSQLLDYYYQRRAESSINKGSRFLISKAVFGTSSLVTKKGDGTYEIG
ncbi:TPA: phage tail protein, partial [Escherichia coli]